MPSVASALVGASLLAACAVAARVRSAEVSQAAWASSPTALSLDHHGGFTIHLFNSKEAQKDPLVKVRPMYKKMFRCRNANPWSCVECSGGPDCLTLKRNPDGSEYLYVEANNSNRKRWRHHRVRVNLHCPESAEFTIGANVTVEGWVNKVGMSVDGMPVRPSDADRTKEKLRTVMLEKTWRGSYSRIVEVDAHVKLRRKGFARINDMVVHMSEDYLMCQDHTACLDILSQTSEGMELRSNNALQLECLQGGLAGNAACESWRRCVDQAASKERLVTLLLAAGVSPDSGSNAFVARKTLAVRGGAGAAQDDSADKEEQDADEEQNPSSGQSSEPQALVNTCIDPRIDDPESWLCSCMDDMEKTCVAISPSFSVSAFKTEDCIAAQMCIDPNSQICSAWKTDVGCNGTKFTAYKAAVADHFNAPAPTPSPTALLARAQRRSHLTSHGSVDSTLKGKTTACE